jgi:hypothetical protein
MKSVLAALLLLVQLQPVLGTVAGQAPTSGFARAGAAAQSCELATLCMPAPRFRASRAAWNPWYLCMK